MTATNSNAFLLSATVHGVALALLLFMSYSLRNQVKEPEKIFELVTGQGDNYGADVAPALGSPGGVKLTIPKPTPPKPEPVVAPAPAPVAEPVPVAPTPPKPDPVHTAPPPDPVKKAPTKQATKAPQKSIARDLMTKLWRAEARGKVAAEKEHQAEVARAKAEAASKLKHIDAEGIAKGVVGGSTENKVGGAGGTALTASEGTAMERYFSMLKLRLAEALREQNLIGLNDNILAEVEFRLSADGTISGAHLIKRSGSAEFDTAVLAAFSHIDMPKRPDGKNGTHSLEFRPRDADAR